MSVEPIGQEISGRDAMEQLPAAICRWMALERFHLHRTDIFQNRSRDPRFDARFLPQNARPFRLPCYLVRRKYMHMYCGPDAPEHSMFLSGRAEDECVLFPIHPSALEEFQPFLSDVRAQVADVPWLWALPTASTRTLLTWPHGAGDRAAFVKTSLHSPLFGDRRLSRIKVGRSLGLDRMVERMSDSLPSELHVIREVLGISPRHGVDSGAIVRAIPPEILRGQAQAAPLFALLGGSENYRPLLLSWLQRTELRPVEFVERLLCASFAPLWVELTLRQGVILEAHGQDLLLQLSAAGDPTGHFYYRDLEGLQIDWELRRGLGAPTPALPNAWAWRETYQTWGYPYGDFIWNKWRVSLFDYLRLVLAEVETSLRQWHEAGLVRGPKCEEGELTMLFSQHVFAAVQRLFNFSMGAPYDILRSMYRFLRRLRSVRESLLRDGTPT